MTNAEWWMVMAGWGLIAVGMISWIWYQTGKADKQLDYDALFIAVAEQLAADQEMKQDAVVPVSGDAWLDQARRAEALAWLDDRPTDDPKRVA